MWRRNALRKLAYWVTRFSRRDIARISANVKEVFPDVPYGNYEAFARSFMTHEFEARSLVRTMEYLPKSSIHKFVRKYMSVEGAELDNALNRDRPIVLVTPHYGTHFLAGLKLQELQRESRIPGVNFFFDSVEKNSTNRAFLKIFKRYDRDISILHNDRRGLVGAMKGLKKKQIVTMFPDVFDVKGNYTVVPFFGQWCSAMRGSAYMARRSDALILPMHIERDSSGFRMVFHPAFEVGKGLGAVGTEHQTMIRIFEWMESVIRVDPAPWAYWRDIWTFLHGPVESTEANLDFANEKNLLRNILVRNRQFERSVHLLAKAASGSAAGNTQTGDSA